MPGLGRIFAPDDRDRAYTLARLLPPITAADGIRYYPPSPILDQGNTGTCVGHGCRGRINAAPIMVKPLTGPSAFDIYRKAVALDEFSDNDGEANAPNAGLQYGTSVRGGMKALQSYGLISNYVWAQSVDEIVNFLLLGQGTVVMGTNWYRGMSDTDSKGFVHPTGPVDGGHCWLITGVNSVSGRVRCQNSWGKAWGDNGRFWLKLTDLERLLSEDGEACVPTEVKLNS